MGDGWEYLNIESEGGRWRVDGPWPPFHPEATLGEVLDSLRERGWDLHPGWTHEWRSVVLRRRTPGTDDQ